MEFDQIIDFAKWFIPLAVSVFALNNSIKARRSSERLEILQYSARLAAAIKMSPEADGQLLSGRVVLSNAGERTITLERVDVSGDAKSETGDFYRVLASKLTPQGRVVLKAGETIDLPFRVVIGFGPLTHLSLDVYVQGSDGKGKKFEGEIHVGDCV